ncbi:hypothetical protein GY45DRAFT_1017360 [Cubamyces sp. BRFM 1775]|nr:hypothetical protein GY45DRAFT_1017360 [Cubamyces sp. BRFM 1775]
MSEVSTKRGRVSHLSSSTRAPKPRAILLPPRRTAPRLRGPMTRPRARAKRVVRTNGVRVKGETEGIGECESWLLVGTYYLFLWVLQ